MTQWKLKSILLLVVLACFALKVDCKAATHSAFSGEPKPPYVSDVASFTGIDCGSKLAACLANLPSTGGICDARGESANLKLSADLVIDKPYTTVYLPQGEIQMGKYSIKIIAATHGVSLLAQSMHGPFTTKGQTRLRYSGKGCAVQIGDPSDNTVGFRADNLFIDLTSADSAASGLCLSRTQNIDIQRPTIFGMRSAENKQVLIKLDGSGNYTGGLIEQPILNSGNIHIWFTGRSGTPQGGNAVTVLHAHSVGNGGSSIAVKIENGDGSTFVGGDYENSGTAFYLGGRAVFNSFYSVRVEGNSMDFVMDSGSQNNMVQTPEALKYVDGGVRNSILLGRYSSTGDLTFRTTETSDCTDRTLRVNGAASGDTIALGTPPPPPNGFFSAFVSAPNVVTVRYCSLQANSTVDGTFRVELSKH
jgi:hypothetical protein